MEQERTLALALCRVEGIGAVSIRKLLEKAGDVSEIRKLPAESLQKLLGGKKAAPDYPGISVAFRGEGMNDVFNEGLICLAWIEYSPEKCLLQAIVYGDGNADDYTQLIEFKNISDQDK